MQVTNSSWTLTQMTNHISHPRPKRSLTIGLRSGIDNAEEKLEKIRLLLDQGQASGAQQVIERILKQTKSRQNTISFIAKIRCALSLTYEMQGRYRESLDAISAYENSLSREGLDDEALACVRLHLGLAYNYTGDHPKAVAMLRLCP